MVSRPNEIMARLSRYSQRRPHRGENAAKFRQYRAKPSPALVLVRLWGGEVS